MASELRVTTIANNAGTESVDTTYVINGSAKMWVDVTGVSTASINKSLNTSGLTDNGTGDYTVSFTNNFDGGNYSVVAEVAFTTTGDAQNTRITTIAAGSVRALGTNTGNAIAADCRRLFKTAHGDLA